MATAQQSVTATELLAISASRRCELVQGELREMSPAGFDHGRIAVLVTTHLANHVATHDLGLVLAAETGFILARQPDTVRAPDVAFVRRERVAAVGNVEGYWPGAPDLAVEVVSPNDQYTEVEGKVMQWLEAGCRMVVVVNPRQRAVTVYYSTTEIVRLTEHDTLDGRDIVPHWQMPLREIFA